MPTRDAAERVVDPAAAAELGPDSSAGDLVRWRLTTLRVDLATHAQEARRGEPDGVHRARVTCRRLRAALATLRPVLPRDASDPMRAELRWLARALGDARDCEVAHARLVELLDAEPTDVVGGPVGERIAEHHRMTSEAAARRAEDALDSPRYQQLADALELLAGHPLEHPDRVEPALELVRLRVRRGARPGAAADGDHRRACRGARARRCAPCRTPGRQAPALRLRGRRAGDRSGGRPPRKGDPSADPGPGRPAGHPGDPARPRPGCPGRHRRRGSATAPTGGCARPRSAGPRSPRRRPCGPGATWTAPSWSGGSADRSAQRAWDTLDMLKSGMRSAGVAVREK